MEFPKPTPAPKRAVMRTKCDILAGRICKLKAKNRCLNCKSTYIPNWAHIVSRGYLSTRWDEDNCFCLCQKCHMYFTNHPVEWENFVIKQIGIEKYDELKQRAISYKKVNFFEVHANLKIRLAQLEQEEKSTIIGSS